MAIEKIDHIGVMVKDLEASISFYQDILGLDVIHRFLPTPTIEVARMGYEPHKEVIIELMQGSKENLPKEGIVNHIGFKVSEIEEEVKRLKEKNVHFTMEDIYDLDGLKFIFFEGPDGELLELYQPLN